MSSTDVTVCLPWRATPDRQPAYDRCVQYWRDHGYRVVCGDSSRGLPFNRAQARNNAVRFADTTGMLIIADADTLPADHTQICDAITAAATGNAVWPYTRYHLLPRDAVNTADLHTVTPLREYPLQHRPGGIIVLTATTYEQIGGFDRRFGAGWGYEDAAFMLAAKTLVGIQTLPGIAYAFDHHGVRRRNSRNRDLYRRYQRVASRPDAMRRLLSLPRTVLL